MKTLRIVCIVTLSFLLQSSVLAEDTWSITEQPTVNSLLEITLRSAISASTRGDMQAALHRIRLQQSAAQYAEPDQLGTLLLQVYETVSGLPIDDAAPLRNLRQTDLDTLVLVLLRQQSSDALESTTKLSWKLAIVELLVEVKPAGYTDVSQGFLVPIATDRGQDASDRARAFGALARGFRTGDLPDDTVRRLTENLADEDYDMKRLQLGVLGQVGNAETLSFLKAARDTNSFSDVRENVDFAIGKLSYHLEGERSAKEEVLKSILGQEDPLSLLLIDWALQQVVQDHYGSLLGFLEERHKAYESSDQRFLAQGFRRAIDALRGQSQTQGEKSESRNEKKRPRA